MPTQGSASATGVVFGAWTDVNNAVRGRLQQDTTVVPDDLLNPIVTAFANWLVSQYPCIVSYSRLVGADKTSFDYGLALMVASHVRPWMPKASRTGELTNYTHVTTRFAYSRTTGTAQKSTNVLGQALKNIEQQWLDEAWMFLRQVSCIGTQVAAQKAKFHIYSQAGRRRRQQSAGYVHLAGNPLYNLQIDDLFAWTDVWSRA